MGLNTLVIRAESASRMNRVEYTLVINREKAAVYVETGGTAVTPKPSYSLKEQRTGYIGGYPDGTFRPEQAVTRGEMAQMLFELLAFENVTPKHPYEDVKGTWVDNAVGVLYTLEIIRDAGASFRMDEPASRAEFVQALGSLLKLDGAAAEGFADTIGHPQEALFSAFKKAGILQGYPDGTVRPDGEMTRAEMIVILNRVLELPDQTGASIFQDVPDSHWACAAINAAADRS